jgi:DNA polymerase-3 subunit gamma/tau
MELYRKHRPTKFSQVIGQPTAVRILTDLVRTKKIPHAVLFTGPSGCGKTTLARILTTKLNCLENDCCELNAADARGIDTIREIRRFMGYKAMAGSTRVWLLDEAHLLTNEAQSALLKILEDPPDHAYFMLCTTHEAKLLPTVRGRCTEVRVTSMFDAALRQLVETAAEKEGLTLSKELLKQIVECCDGSGRKALVLLEQIAGIEDEKERIDPEGGQQARRHRDRPGTRQPANDLGGDCFLAAKDRRGPREDTAPGAVVRNHRVAEQQERKPECLYTPHLF